MMHFIKSNLSDDKKNVEQNEATKQDKLQLILEYYTQYKISKESSISVQKNLFLDVLITNETVVCGYNESINEPPYHENKGHSSERFICCVMIFNCTPEETKTTDDTILYMIYTCIRSSDQIQFCLRQSDDYVTCQYIKINPLLSRGYQEYTWFVSFTVSLFVCSTGFFSRHPCCTRLQKGCLWSPHTIPMESLTDSCQWSRGIVRPDSGCGFDGSCSQLSGSDSDCLL